MSIPDFFGAFYFYKNEALTTYDGRDVNIECQEVGKLFLPTGDIVACDGLIPDVDAFEQKVKPGSYPVILSLALTNLGRHVACAMLHFSDTMPKIFKPAIVANGGSSYQHEYGVDTGTGCFADLEAINALLDGPEKYERLKQEVHKPDVDWVDFRVSESCNILVFSSGEGDGTYPSYFGYDADGNAVCLATDFGIIAPLSNKKTEEPNGFQLKLDF